MKMEQTECSKTSAYTIQTPGNYAGEIIQERTYLQWMSHMFQGWEEVADAALSHLLRTSLAKDHTPSQRLAPITLEPTKDIARLKKHISSALDRVSKGSQRPERKDNVGETLRPVNPVSPIPEAVEGGHDDDAVVPVGSQYGERAVSARPRGRSAVLHKARVAARSPAISDSE